MGPIVGIYSFRALYSLLLFSFLPFLSGRIWVNEQSDTAVGVDALRRLDFLVIGHHHCFLQNRMTDRRAIFSKLETDFLHLNHSFQFALSCVGARKHLQMRSTEVWELILLNRWDIALLFLSGFLL